MAEKVKSAYCSLPTAKQAGVTVFIILLILIVGSFVALATTATYSGHTPEKSATVSTASPAVSVYIKHTRDLRQDRVIANVNGMAFPATFEPKGFWYQDYDTGEWLYGIESHREGTIRFQAVNLPDGLRTAQVSIEDVQGTVLTESWSFTVTERPRITLLTPAGGSEQSSVAAVSAVITDNGAVNWSQTAMRINGALVSPLTIDTATGRVSFNRNFADGTHTVRIDTRDTAGNSATQSWSFTVDNQPPAITYMHHFQNGMIITGGQLRFNVQLNDLCDIKNNAALRLNGQLLGAEFRYKGEWSYEGDEYYITSRKEAYLSYDAPVANGQHTLTLYAEDSLGNFREYVWTFTAGQQPVFSDMSPVAYGLKLLTPVISARVSGVPRSITLKLNGETVAHSFSGGVVSYVVTSPLKDESYHTVELTVVDVSGRSTDGRWTFYTNAAGYPDMPDSSIDGCLACHELYPFSGTAGPWESVHGRRLIFYDSHRPGTVWDCAKCHNYINVPADCAQCHGDFLNNIPQYGYAPHGSTPGIQYDLVNYDKSFPVRVLKNREMFDCVICHQPGVNIARKSGGALTNHDIPQLHMSDDNGCGECHALSLTREHAREGRTDRNKNPIDCLTCHGSTDEKIQGAIAGKDTSCVACHTLGPTGPAHSEFHEVGYGVECEKCHNANMMTEKQYHASGGCEVCHDSTDTKVRGAIRWKKSSCFDCHNQPHGVYMSVVRDDIPLYSGVKWGTPQDATLYSGDGWLPDLFKDEQARIVFSSRGTAAADVYQYYMGAMTGQGWTLQEDSYTGGTQAFSLSYTKGRRYCNIWYFTGDIPGAGGPLGGRILIAYY